MALVEGTFHSVDELVDDARANMEWLKAHLGYSYREIAALSGMAEKTVMRASAKVEPRLTTLAQIIAAMGAEPRDLTLPSKAFRAKYKGLVRDVTEDSPLCQPLAVAS